MRGKGIRDWTRTPDSALATDHEPPILAALTVAPFSKGLAEEV